MNKETTAIDELFEEIRQLKEAEDLLQTLFLYHLGDVELPIQLAIRLDKHFNVDNSE